MARSNSQAKKTAYELGLAGEERVADHFLQRGFDILGKRLRTPYGEIDLIVSNTEWIIGIEVKTRARFSDAAFALSARQAQRLLNAFGWVIATQPSKPFARFDLFLVDHALQLRQIKDVLRVY